MRKAALFRFLAPVGAALARQLAHPRGWFGRTVMMRVLNLGNQDLIAATLQDVALGPETRLLDVGFGGGLLLELAGRRGVRRLAGIDPSEEAVARLRGRRGAGSGAELRLEVGVVEALPFADASFDVVASTNTVYFWPDLARAFAELRRVLAPGGTLTVGFSGAAKMRSFDAITRHGFQLHEAPDLLAHEREGLQRREVRRVLQDRVGRAQVRVGLARGEVHLQVDAKQLDRFTQHLAELRFALAIALVHRGVGLGSHRKSYHQCAVCELKCRRHDNAPPTDPSRYGDWGNSRLRSRFRTHHGKRSRAPSVSPLFVVRREERLFSYKAAPADHEGTLHSTCLYARRTC